MHQLAQNGGDVPDEAQRFGAESHRLPPVDRVGDARIGTLPGDGEDRGVADVAVGVGAREHQQLLGGGAAAQAAKLV